MSILSAADIRKIRGLVFVGDLVEEYREIGLGATVATAAAIGGVSLTLEGLGSGTIVRGTQLGHSVSGVVTTYTVTADVAIASNRATVSISPGLLTPATVGESVKPVPVYLSVYNAQTGTQLFSDTQLEDFAQQVQEGPWAAQIARSEDPKRRLYVAIRILAREAKLAEGSAFRRALAADDPSRGGISQVEDMHRAQEEDLKFFTFRAKGFMTSVLYQ